MSYVQRYEPFGFTNRGGGADAKMLPIEDGEWVKYEDHAALKTKIRELCASALAEGENRVDRVTEREYREWREQKAEGEK